MPFPFKAVILDMDGVLIDSEHLWRKAMIAGFAEYGVNLTEDECRSTMGKRIGEVVKGWTPGRTGREQLDIETRIVSILLGMIAAEGKAIDGANDIIEFCRQHRIPIGLATSSPVSLVNAVLEKLKLTGAFDAVVSAENMTYAKPHPEVYLRCASLLKTEPADCVAVEDSLNGVISAKAACMKVVAVPDSWHTRIQQFAVADFRRDSMRETYELFTKMAGDAG